MLYSLRYLLGKIGLLKKPADEPGDKDRNAASDRTDGPVTEHGSASTPWNLTSEVSRSEQPGAQKYKILPLVLRVLSGPIGALPNTGQDFVFLYSLKSKKYIYGYR